MNTKYSLKYLISLTSILNISETIFVLHPYAQIFGTVYTKGFTQNFMNF
jgi:hypothetical protein